MERAVRDEISRWQDGDAETAFIELVSVEPTVKPLPIVHLTVGEEEEAFQVAMPAQFPRIGRSDRFRVAAVADGLQGQWERCVFLYILFFVVCCCC